MEQIDNLRFVGSADYMGRLQGSTSYISQLWFPQFEFMIKNKLTWGLSFWEPSSLAADGASVNKTSSLTGVRLAKYSASSKHVCE